MYEIVEDEDFFGVFYVVKGIGDCIDNGEMVDEVFVSNFDKGDLMVLIFENGVE